VAAILPITAAASERYDWPNISNTAGSPPHA